MDTFIDKLSQKKNAQEMILANMTAEAAKMEQMQQQLKTYDGLMQEIRQVNLKTASNLEQMQHALQECMDKIGELQQREETESGAQDASQMQAMLDEKFARSDDFLHKENVKVYRNVQAAVADELNKQTEELKKSQKENRTSRAVLPLTILILLAVLADIAVQLLAITNFKFF